VGDREQMGSGASPVTRTDRALPRTYLAPSAQAPVVLRRARTRCPSRSSPRRAACPAMRAPRLWAC